MPTISSADYEELLRSHYEVTALRAQVETLTKERDDLAAWKREAADLIVTLTHNKAVMEGQRNAWQTEAVQWKKQWETVTRERDEARKLAAKYQGAADYAADKWGVDREKVRRLVECVRKIKDWNEDGDRDNWYWGLSDLVDTVSDITAPTDGVK